MTGPLGNSEFCFHNQNSLFPSGPVIKCLMVHCDEGADKVTNRAKLVSPSRVSQRIFVATSFRASFEEDMVLSPFFPFFLCCWNLYYG